MSRNKIVLIVIGILFSISIQQGASHTSLLLGANLPKSTRFLPIATARKNQNKPKSSGIEALMLKITSELPGGKGADLWDRNTKLSALNITDFPRNWYPWMFKAADPTALATVNGFDSYHRQNRELPLPQRNQKSNKHLEPTFVPTSFEPEYIKEWLNANNCAFQNYLEGKGRFPRFFYDLLRRKVQTIIANLPESERTSCGQEAILESHEIFFEAYSLPELAAYLYKIDNALGRDPNRKFLYHAIPNGVPITLTYERGIIRESYTTIFGQKKDLTDLLSTIKIPRTTSKLESLRIHGYVYLDASAIELINSERRGRGMRDWVDSYSAVADALLRSDEPNRFLELRLKCVFDTLEKMGHDEEQINKTNQFQKLKVEGFPTIDDRFVMLGDNRLGIAFIQSNKYYPFELLGYKVAINDVSERHLLKDLDAFVKFAPEFQRTKIESIKFEVLENGNILAIVHTFPVTLGGSEHTRFTISNETQLIELNLHPGDDIETMLIPGGEPRIYKSFGTGGKEYVRYPKECPQCLNPLSRMQKHSETIVCCAAHLKCKDETLEEIMRFSSVYGLHLPSLTESFIRELKRKSKAFNYIDLMELTFSGHRSLENISREEYITLLDEIRLAKQTTLPRLLYALNIPAVDFVVAEKLADQFGTLNRISTASVSDLCSENLMNYESAQQVKDWFGQQASVRKIKKLLEKGVRAAEPDEKIDNMCYKSDAEYTQSDYSRIVSEINKYTHTYGLSDSDYDKLCSVADSIESRNPDWVLEREDKGADSAQTIPSELLKKETVRYLGKTYSINDISALCLRLKQKGQDDTSLEFVVEPKVDGIACFLQYAEGKLVAAYTKKATMGNNISELAKKIPAIPNQLKVNFSGIIRCELFITKDNFAKINEGIIQAGEDGYADSLSLLVGIINSTKEKRFSVLSSLEVFPFWIVPDEFQHDMTATITPETIHKIFGKLGFSCSIKNKHQKFSSINQVIAHVKNVTERRIEQPTNIDGIVIKNASSKECVAVAYKFDRKTRNSSLTGVNFFLTKNKRLQAVASMTPLSFGNREISRVYVPNPTVLDGASIGDLVSIHYAVGSAPIFNTIKLSSSKTPGLEKVKINLPRACPSCSSALTNQKGYLWCKNPRCNGEKHTQEELMLYARKMGFISPWTPSVWIKELLDKKTINTFGDFFRLTAEDIVSASSLDNDKAKVLLSQIERSTNISKAYFIKKLIPTLQVKTEVLDVLLEAPNILTLKEKSPQELSTFGMSPRQSKILHGFIQKHWHDLTFCFNYLKPKSASNSQSSQEGIQRVVNSFEDRRRVFRGTILNASKQLVGLFAENERDLLMLIRGISPRSDEGQLSKVALRKLQDAHTADKALLEKLTKYAMRSEVPAILRTPKYVSELPNDSNNPYEIAFFGDDLMSESDL